ncbi:Mpv17/PMP22 family protein [Colletotrichum paranaense]|uniref:Mpv17/PMP22 family protein n=6 Tax=Colletotrichum acutatum species complex TaxID=2707335 RepID=A0A9Q8WC97_9PEZI|nr:Mpv17/PMP22 family protein [Colletotrichum lupini]XP_060318740.1 Mpv17/PMP22 family protein [Colletotrichum costaricense]XP_060340985.1 Mpv17/PMP22 family protein [Colletotrichum paranaense]KAI3530772.1 Mpv17/PMP22 family protein [Colletotrichum filicis]KAK0368716.1 Mpv17/PMP22 family protein [Colletotrichum limetticola]KAK1467125.1 Mpv17/PMP22 family protein [Colletotrichum melonis]KXH37418.1 Mpv17/PMP22 family protein [Colletotrichum simmondsii]KAK1517443.1 Mpv17/PMP22 family protein [C
MPSILATAIQSSLLKGTANFTAQIVNQHRQAGGSAGAPLDVRRVLEFATFGFIQGHINYWWQHFLEDQFPNSASSARGRGRKASIVEPKIEKPEKPEKAAPKNYFNVARKVLVDQTVGLFMMNSAFLLITSALRFGFSPIVYQIWSERIFDLIKAAWKFWPLVAMLNFALVPVGYRALVGMCVGFIWNMFLTFFLL